ISQNRRRRRTGRNRAPGGGAPAVKLIALLRDSFREALDRKIFAAMLLLSGLVTLFLASISYRRITLEEEVQATARLMTFSMSFNPHGAKPTYTIESFRQTNDAIEPWHGDYAFDWVVKCDDPGAFKQIPFTKVRDVRHIL